jgi:hypothetical protein
MSDTNPTGLIKELIADFEYYVKDIDRPLYKTWLKPAIKSHMDRTNKDVPREIIEKLVDLIYLTDHV